MKVFVGFKSHLLQHWFMFIALLFFDSCCIYGVCTTKTSRVRIFVGFRPLLFLRRPLRNSWGICFLRVWHSGPRFLVFEKKKLHFKGTDSCPFQMDMYIYIYTVHMCKQLVLSTDYIGNEFLWQIPMSQWSTLNKLLVFCLGIPVYPQPVISTFCGLATTGITPRCLENSGRPVWIEWICTYTCNGFIPVP